jgi:hypothetical protein
LTDGFRAKMKEISLGFTRPVFTCLRVLPTRA